MTCGTLSRSKKVLLLTAIAASNDQDRLFVCSALDNEILLRPSLYRSHRLGAGKTEAHVRSDVGAKERTLLLAGAVGWGRRNRKVIKEHWL